MSRSYHNQKYVGANHQWAGNVVWNVNNLIVVLLEYIRDILCLKSAGQVMGVNTLISCHQLITRYTIPHKGFLSLKFSAKLICG